MSATCNSAALQLSGAFAILAPTAGIVVGIGTADPALGFLVFRSVGVVGAATSASFAATCLGLNAAVQRQCLTQATANGC
jgi:hypothetical protein